MDTIIKVDGTIQDVTPKNGLDYHLDELKEFIGGGWIEIIPLGSKQVMVLDEEGKLKKFKENGKATAIARPYIFRDDYIVGDVLVCDRDKIK